MTGAYLPGNSTTELRDVILLMDRAAEWRELATHPPQAMRESWPAIEELSAATVATAGRFFQKL